MGAISNVVIKDGASTPATHTFAPVTSQNGTTPATWSEKNTSYRIGDKVLTMSTRVNTQNTRRVELQLAIPEVVTVDNAPKLNGTLRATISLIVPEGVSQQSVKDFAAFFQDFTSLQIVNDAIVLGDIQY